MNTLKSGKAAYRTYRGLGVPFKVSSTPNAQPEDESTFSFDEFEEWREGLGLSMEDCANLLGVSLSSLNKIKAHTISGTQVLRILELVCCVPEVLDYQLQKRGKLLHPKKTDRLWEEVWQKTNLSQNDVSGCNSVVLANAVSRY